MSLSPLLGIMLSPAHAYLPRDRVKCGTLWRLEPFYPSLLVLHCLFHHTCILGSSITRPYTRLPSASNIVEFLVFSAEKGSENPLPPKGKSRLLIGLIACLLFIYLHLAHSLSIYGIISRCPMYRIQVASDSADVQPVFDRFTNSSDRDQKFNSQLRSSKSGP